MQRRITGSLCTQTVCARNMLHLKTLGRETNLSSTKILHIERHTGREWRIHPHVHKNTPHAYFGPAQTPPWTPLHSKRAHNIRHLRERAHLVPIKCAMSSHVWARSGCASECIPYACFGQSQTHAGIPLHSQDACNAAPSTARVAL